MSEQVPGGIEGDSALGVARGSLSAHLSRRLAFMTAEARPAREGVADAVGDIGFDLIDRHWE